MLCAVQDVLGAHATPHGRALSSRRCSAPRSGGARGACVDGGAARRDAVGGRQCSLIVMYCSGCAWTAQNTAWPCTACAAWQRASDARVGFGRVGPLSHRLRSERGEPFQAAAAVPSAELSSAGHVGKFEPGFGLVAKPAHPLWNPLRGGGASGRRKKSGPKPA